MWKYQIWQLPTAIHHVESSTKVKKESALTYNFISFFFVSETFEGFGWENSWTKINLIHKNSVVV